MHRVHPQLRARNRKPKSVASEDLERRAWWRETLDDAPPPAYEMFKRPRVSDQRIVGNPAVLLLQLLPLRFEECE
jgi:hypothetical protein